LRQKCDYKIAVIKNIHKHKIESEIIDTKSYLDAGAKWFITKNYTNEIVIFLRDNMHVDEILHWLNSEIDITFIEGFRKLTYPTILCLKDIKNLKTQFSKNIVAISGIISKDIKSFEEIEGFPLINLNDNFGLFKKLVFGMTPSKTIK